MKYRHLFWGVLLIAIGMLFVLNNLGVISFSWYSVWRLWPLILIIWGISILPMRDTVKFSVLIIVLVGTFFVINRLPRERPFFLHFHHHGDDNSWEWDDESSSGNYRDQSFTVQADTLCTRGILNLEAAAGNFSMEGTTREFLEFSKKGAIGNYELTTKDNNGTKDISIHMQEGKVHGSFHKNKVEIRLNPDPSWNLLMDVGAADLTFDLSDYKIDTVTIDAGASSMDIKVGDKNPVTVMTFDAGASSINVKVPKTSGCQITSESFLVSKDFKGFTKKEAHVYQTENFASAQKKIYITIQTAVSSIDVERY